MLPVEAPEVLKGPCPKAGNIDPNFGWPCGPACLQKFPNPFGCPGKAFEVRGTFPHRQYISVTMSVKCCTSNNSHGTTALEWSPGFCSSYDPPGPTSCWFCHITLCAEAAPSCNRGRGASSMLCNMSLAGPRWLSERPQQPRSLQITIQRAL